MTQIIAYLGHEFICLASDKRLTNIDSNGIGNIYTEDECKLVSLCGHSCIGYTGIARLDGKPTHEWIATVLANNGCCNVVHAAELLLQNAPKHINRFDKRINGTAFVVAGYIETNKGVLPYLSRISNCYDDSGNFLKFSRKDFVRQDLILKPEHSFIYTAIGVPLKPKQQRTLGRSLKRVARNGALPKSTLRLICDEIIASSATGSPTVGKKILGVSIPKAAFNHFYASGNGSMAASQPNNHTASFVYLEEGYNDMMQYGPTVACGNSAYTNFTSTRSEDGKKISASIRYLVVPKQS